METKTYSSSGFSHQCSVEELYVLTRHWVSDIFFFEQEINFFRSFIQNYFLSEIDEQITPIRMIESKLEELEFSKELLKEEIISHQNRLSAILDKNHIDEQSHFNVIQSKLEGKVFDFLKTFRCIKQELFKFNRVNQKTTLVPNT